MIVFETACASCGAPIKLEASTDEEIHKLQDRLYRESDYCNAQCQYGGFWDCE